MKFCLSAFVAIVSSVRTNI